jgi:restriction system protein
MARTRKKTGATLRPSRRRQRRELSSLQASGQAPSMEEILASIRRIIAEDDFNRAAVSLIVSSIVTPTRKSSEGTLIKATGLVWMSLVNTLRNDWSRAFEIPPDKWEEIIAGAFDKAGYDEVTLTPRSGDHGRDVIAVKRGVGSVKILGSMKAYRPSNLVPYDAVRSMVGVLAGERNASKGIVATTSDFPPKIASDPFIAPFMPYRLELMNGEQLKEWLSKLVMGEK